MTVGGRLAIIFDFDGVLVNSEVIAIAELQDILRDFGIDSDWDQMIRNFLGASFDDIEAYIHRETGSYPGNGFRETWYARLFDHYVEDLTVMPGAIELLDRLDERGITYCIASGGSYRRLKFALDVTGLGLRFGERVFSRDSVARGKPAPDLFLFAAEHMGIDAGVVVEDAVPGVRAAVAAGIDTIGFVGGDHVASGREEHGKQLREAGASAVVTDIRDVLKFVGPGDIALAGAEASPIASCSGRGIKA